MSHVNAPIAAGAAAALGATAVVRSVPIRPASTKGGTAQDGPRVGDRRRGVLETLGKDTRTAALPVLVLTAKALPKEEARVTGAGAKRFLTKPVDPDDLAGELERLLEAG